MMPVWFDTLAVIWSVLLFAGMVGYSFAMNKPKVARRNVLRSEERRLAAPLPKQRVLEAC